MLNFIVDVLQTVYISLGKYTLRQFGVFVDTKIQLAVYLLDNKRGQMQFNLVHTCMEFVLLVALQVLLIMLIVL